MQTPDDATDGRRPTRPQPIPRITSEPQLSVPGDVLARFNARILDPATAPRARRRSGDDDRFLRVRPTIYIADQLIVRAPRVAVEGGDLATAAADAGATLDWDNAVPLLRRTRDPEEVAVAPKGAEGHDGPVRVPIVSDTSQAVARPPDAWRVLQNYRASVGDADQANVALDHLMISATGPSIGGVPFVGGHGVGGVPFVGGHAVASTQYGFAGSGGRQPVSWQGMPPDRKEKYEGRRPVVAVLDTGVGKHPWLPADIVRLDSELLIEPVADCEATGVTEGPYEGVLDPQAGHGTFIAGIIRQQCGDADILAIPIMSGAGVVAESNLLEVLHRLSLRQEQAVADGDQAAIIDVLSLSLGYYHELIEDVSFDPLIREPLESLARHGVTVVAAAGNDSTDRPLFPAAFAIDTLETDRLPVISVGALNPNNTVALFSNAGRWVTCRRPGAAIVSTFPTTINAAMQPTYKLFDEDAHRYRETIDDDDFSSGFAVWSGTSFAAPFLAGQLAAQLCAKDLTAVDKSVGVKRGWDAVTACLPELQRPS